MSISLIEFVGFFLTCAFNLHTLYVSQQPNFVLINGSTLIIILLVVVRRWNLKKKKNIFADQIRIRRRRKKVENV